MADISTFGYYWLDTWVMANIIQLATQKNMLHFRCIFAAGMI